MKPWVLASLVATGCLSVPSSVATQCDQTADCGGNGEVCVEHMCFGDPPTGMFAAAISPPADRSDLAAIELPTIALPSTGDLGDLMLEAPVTFSGRVEASCAPPTDCTSRLSLDAKIVVTRPSAIPGWLPFTATATSLGGATEGTSFQIALPRTGASDQPYTITIIPSGNGPTPDTNIMAAQLVPPLRIQTPLTDSATGMDLELGGATLPVIDGTLTDSLSGIANYRVVARGQWNANDPAVEVSTVAYTMTDGHFKLTLSDGLVGTVELVATPFDGTAPTLHLANIDATTSSTHILTSPAGLGNPTTVSFNITGYNGAGQLSPVAGARVIVNAAVAPRLDVITTLSAEGTTDDTGAVSLQLLDGATITPNYLMSIVPPASSNLGAIYAQAIVIGGDQDVALPQRVALRGILVDTSGNPLADVAVTSYPSASFLGSLDPVASAFLSAIPPATTVTPGTGDFVVWVDPILAQVWGHYDLVFEPQNTSSPDWSMPDVEIPRIQSQTTVSLPNVTIPDAAFVHGVIVDPTGASVEMAELQLFLVAAGGSQLEGRGTSMAYTDGDVGEVRLTVARP